MVAKGFAIGGHRNQLKGAVIAVDGLADTTSKVGRGAEHIVKAHVTGDGAIVEKDIHVAAGVGAAVGMLQKAAIGATGINLAAAHFLPGIALAVVADHGTTALHLGRGQHGELDPLGVEHI